MPPFKNVSPIFSRDAVAALWDTGIGTPVAIINAHYQAPSNSRTADMLSGSVPDCLAAVLNLIDVETEVNCLIHEGKSRTTAVHAELKSAAKRYGHTLLQLQNYGEQGPTLEAVELRETITVAQAARLLGITYDAVAKRAFEEAPGSRQGRILLVAAPIFAERAERLAKLGAVEPPRHTAPRTRQQLGFYGTLAANPDSLILRTADIRPTVCALVTVGKQESSA